MAKDPKSINGVLSRLGIKLEVGGYGSEIPIQRTGYISRPNPERPLTEYEKAVGYIPRPKPERPMTEYEKAVAKLQNKLSLPSRQTFSSNRLENVSRSFLRPAPKRVMAEDPITVDSDDNLPFIGTDKFDYPVNFSVKTEFPEDSDNLMNDSNIDDLAFENNPLQPPNDEEFGLGPTGIEDDTYDTPASPTRLQGFDEGLNSRNQDIRHKIKKIKHLEDGVLPESEERNQGGDGKIKPRNDDIQKKIKKIKQYKGAIIEPLMDSYQTTKSPENYPLNLDSLAQQESYQENEEYENNDQVIPQDSDTKQDIKTLKEEFPPLHEEFIPLGEEFGPVDGDLSSLPLPLDFYEDDNVLNKKGKKKRRKDKTSKTIKSEKPIKTEANLFDIKPKIKAEDIENIVLDENVVDRFEVVESDGSLVQKFECKICDFITKDPKYLQRHLRENHDYKISVSMKKKIPEDIKEHFGVEGDSFKCKKCGYLAKKKKYLLRHIKDKHLEDDEITEEEQNCPNCNFRTHRTRSLRKHIKVNHSEHLPDKRCDRCEYTTKQNHRLKRHINEVHEALRDQNCDQCEKSFKRKAKLVMHIKVIHQGLKIERKKYPWNPGPERRLTCTMCAFVTRHKSNMNKHINNVHFKLEASMCPHCEFRCTRKRTMSAHIKFVHDKCRDHECPDCGYLFYSDFKLRKHQQAVHLKIKDKICEHCGAGFFGRGNLREHIKVVHFQIREYRCDECGFEATARTNLKVHLVNSNHTSKLDKLNVDFDVVKMAPINLENGLTLPPQESPTAQPQQAPLSLPQQPPLSVPQQPPLFMPQQPLLPLPTVLPPQTNNGNISMNNNQITKVNSNGDTALNIANYNVNNYIKSTRITNNG